MKPLFQQVPEMLSAIFENRLSLQQVSALYLQLLEIGYTAPSLIKERNFLSHSRAG